MRYEITHTTHYQFSKPVWLEPHLLRFRPRSDGAQVVLDHALHIQPRAQGVSAHLDAEGNAVSRAWFQSETDHLTLTAVSQVDSTRRNPFDYLLTENNASLPVTYPLELQPVLSAARRRSRLPAATDPVLNLARDLADRANQELTSFLLLLAQHIQGEWDVFQREEGTPWSPEQTFERKTGACRDLAWLFVDACRASGLAARFVSGYLASPDENLRREMHAWAEVYVPSAGWRGYDPTEGLAVADRHIAIAASIDPVGTSPVAGSFRGTNTDSEMTTEIEIVTSEALTS